LSGQLDQDPPPGSSLQQIGEDLQYQKQVGGRRYSVVERRYLLIPERSGALMIPGARFNGQAAGGFFDDVFGGRRVPLSAAAPDKRLQVKPIPLDAPTPWLPLHDLRLRYVQAPQQARAGVATTVELEMIADGASASQLPALAFPPTKDAQVFADPPQTDVQLVDGRPRAILRLQISIVPLHAGTLSLAGPRVDWWDATQGVPRTATLPSLELQVAPGALTKNMASDAGSAGAPQSSADVAARQDGKSPVVRGIAGFRKVMPWLAAMLGLALLIGGWWFARQRKFGTDAIVANSSTTTGTLPKTLSLADALTAGELADIAQALCSNAGLPGDDLDTLCMRLDDVEQVAAVGQMQAARWGDGDAAAALASLRAAFSKGLRLRRKNRQTEALLPPLYPQS
jgi:hypothetical protein